MTALQRHPVGVGVAGTAALMAVLSVLAVTLPLSGNAAHFGGHAAMGVPLLLLLALMTRTWPRPGPGVVGRLARGTLLAGLAVSGVGLLVEAVGAFGYDEAGFGRANALVTMHDIGVALWPVGFVLLLAGVVLSVGSRTAERRGGTRSELVTAAVVLVVLTAVLFVAGGFVLGY